MNQEANRENAGRDEQECRGIEERSARRRRRAIRYYPLLSLVGSVLIATMYMAAGQGNGWAALAIPAGGIAWSLCWVVVTAGHRLALRRERERNPAPETAEIAAAATPALHAAMMGVLAAT